MTKVIVIHDELTIYTGYPAENNTCREPMLGLGDGAIYNGPGTGHFTLVKVR
jgi:hypothetical protein